VKFALKFIGENSQRYLPYEGIEKSEECGQIGIDVLDPSGPYLSYYHTIFCELPFSFQLEAFELNAKAAKGRVMVHFIRDQYKRYSFDVTDVQCADTNIKKAFKFAGRLGIQVEVIGNFVKPEVTLRFGGSDECESRDERGTE